MKITGKIVTLILLIVFFAGLCVLLYPAFSQYWNSKVQSRAVVDYERSINLLSGESYSKIFEEAYLYNNNLSKTEAPLINFEQVKGYSECLNVSGNGMIGYIDIDKIGVELPIYHGTDASVISMACGHLEGSSLPVGGLGTHSVLSAHRGLPSAKLFTNLDRMEVGDTFNITVLGEVLTYQVDRIKIVNPTDTSDLQIESGKDYCTLVTCTPYGINTHRLLVRGSRVATPSQRRSVITSEAYVVDKLIVTPVVALPIIFILIVYVIFKPVKKKVRIENLNEKN